MLVHEKWCEDWMHLTQNNYFHIPVQESWTLTKKHIAISQVMQQQNRQYIIFHISVTIADDTKIQLFCSSQLLIALQIISTRKTFQIFTYQFRLVPSPPSPSWTTCSGLLIPIERATGEIIGLYWMIMNLYMCPWIYLVAAQ